MHGMHQPWSTQQIQRPRILVTAPSNAATDELVCRVLNDGFFDLEGQVYQTEESVLRVGSDNAEQSGGGDRRMWINTLVRKLVHLTPQQWATWCVESTTNTLYANL